MVVAMNMIWVFSIFFLLVLSSDSVFAFLLISSIKGDLGERAGHGISYFFELSRFGAETV